MSIKICSKCKTIHPIEMYGIINKKLKFFKISFMLIRLNYFSKYFCKIN